MIPTRPAYGTKKCFSLPPMGVDLTHSSNSDARVYEEKDRFEVTATRVWFVRIKELR